MRVYNFFTTYFIKHLKSKYYITLIKKIFRLKNVLQKKMKENIEHLFSLIWYLIKYILIVS